MVTSTGIEVLARPMEREPSVPAAGRAHHLAEAAVCQVKATEAYEGGDTAGAERLLAQAREHVRLSRVGG